MKKPPIQLALIVDENIYEIESFKRPPNKKLEAFIEEKIEEIRRAMSSYEYQQNLPEPGMSSGCW